MHITAVLMNARRVWLGNGTIPSPVPCNHMDDDMGKIVNIHLGGNKYHDHIVQSEKGHGCRTGTAGLGGSDVVVLSV